MQRLFPARRSIDKSSEVGVASCLRISQKVDFRERIRRVDGERSAILLLCGARGLPALRFGARTLLTSGKSRELCVNLFVFSQVRLYNSARF